MKIKRHRHSIPALNMAALPDLIFTVLFFFMVVTHMRQNAEHLKYVNPQGTNLSTLMKKSSLIHLYIGKASDGKWHIQVGDRVVTKEQVCAAVEDEIHKLPSESQDNVTAALRIDQNAPMELVKELKAQLRMAEVQRICYIANENINKDNN